MTAVCLERHDTYGSSAPIHRAHSSRLLARIIHFVFPADFIPRNVSTTKLRPRALRWYLSTLKMSDAFTTFRNLPPGLS